MNALNRWGAAASVLALGAVGAVVAGSVATADNGSDDKPFTITKRLGGYQEVLAVSTGASGSVRLRVDPAAGTITYTVRYANLEGSVLQSHIHFGSRTEAGAVSAFLCSNLGNGPAGTPACPPDNPGEVSGTLTAASVTAGAKAQGIDAGEFSELVAAIRADKPYVNVHSSKFPGGEVRGQLLSHGH
jgi:hypothetical protein